MRRRLFSLVVASLIGSSLICMAQNRPEKGGKGPGQNMEQVISELGLTDQQAQKLKSVFEEMKPARNDSGERPSREEMEKKRTETEAKIKKILTEEQYTKFQNLQKKGREGKKKSED